MSLAQLSIRRPVFAWMLMLFLIVFGYISFERLGISQMPDVDFPVLTVSATWEGAAPDVMESEIVDRIEQSIIAVEGLQDISSNIRQGQANITLEFELSRDVDAALQEVQSSISRVRLPLNVDPPTIRKTNPDDQPIMWVGLSSPDRPLREIINYVELNVRDQFQILPGVAEVFLGGFTERNLRIWADHEKLNKYELTILDLKAALLNGHTEVAAGIIENERSELNLRIMGEGQSVEDVGQIVISQRGGRPIFGNTIKVQDVALVEDGLAEIRRISRVNGIPGVGIGIRKQRGANAVKVGELVHKKVLEMAKNIPSDFTIGVTFDSTKFVKESIEETEFTLLLSALATGLVCWFFLGSLRPTINILLSIPTSIMGSFIVIYFMGFTLNFFTILGLALAIGIVVDDAIMVLENIYRHRDMGKHRVLAALDGANEITFAALAATVAVVAIFLPVAFMQGIIGKFFFQFGVTISTAVLLSLLEALTLTPMRCSEFMEQADKSGFIATRINRLLAGCANFYRILLGIALRFRFSVIILASLIFAGSIMLMPKLRKEFIPAQDQSMFMIRFQTKVGSSLENTSNAIKQAESFIKARPEVVRSFVAVGGFGGGEVNTAVMFVSLKDPKLRTINQSDLMELSRTELSKIEGLKVTVQDLSMRGFTAQRGFPVEFNIRGPDWAKLKELSDQIVAKLEGTNLVRDLDTDYRLGMPEVRVWPLRDEAFKRGVLVENIADTVSTAMGGVRQGRYTADGRRYDVRIRLQADQRIMAEQIANLTVRNIHGELVSIKDLVRIETVPSLQTITRRNRERSISIFANVAPGQSQATALAEVQKLGRELLPDGYRLFLGGGAQTFIDSFTSLRDVMILGLIVAYMVLAAQFNSFIHPFTVLLALPFSLTGAIAALWISDLSLNLYSMIGIVLLMGIAKKNSILLVEFTNQLREEGLDLKSAILKAGPIRLRPILMTTFSTCAAALPPALAIGPGAESRIPMAICVLGGVLVSTVFTLFVVPCAYSLLSRLERSSQTKELLISTVDLTAANTNNPSTESKVQRELSAASR